MSLSELEEKGFVICREVFGAETISRLIAELSKLKPSVNRNGGRATAYGVRNLLNVSPPVRELSETTEIRKIAECFLGEKARIVRAIYFDKTPEANWKVPWHQDLTIAVKERRETEEFAAWTRKAGIWHAQAPDSILRKMLTLRVHLDDANETNGALKVVAGSHRRRLSSAEVQKLPKPFALCRASKGDVMLMRPLLVHSSSAGTSPKHRRVIHFEFSAENLPNNLDWYGS